MITENGIVTAANSSTAKVKTTRSSSCEGCSTRDSCSTGNNAKEMIVTVNNTLNVKKGDHVLIGLQTGPIIFLTFLLYVFPIILLTIGALIGDSIAPSLEMNPSFVAMVFGFSFFGLSFYFIRKKNDSLAEKEEYKPFLVRKKPKAVSPGCSLL